jgi:threonine synthase
MASRGRVVVVEEEAIAEAQETLARVGVVVEPTAAVGRAGMAALDRSGIGLKPPVVIVITGR